MAILGQIRKQQKFLLIIIGLALVLFLVGTNTSRLNETFSDLKNFIFGSHKHGKNVFGYVNKTSISYNDFEQKYKEQIQLLEKRRQQQGLGSLTPEEDFQFRESVWNKMVNDIIMEKEYKSLSIEVPTEEMNDMYYGTFIHQYVYQSFADRKTGQFDRRQVKYQIDNFDKLPPDQKESFSQLEDGVRTSRIREKYSNLISKSYYMPTAFLKKSYDEQNSFKKCRYMAVDFTTVPDNTVSVADKDIQKYYDEHKQEYIYEEDSRDIDYVMFEVKPSAEDWQKINKQRDDYFDTLKIKSVADVPVFINSVSHDYDSTFYAKGKLPPSIDSIMFSSEVGAIVPPFKTDDDRIYKMAKLVDVQYRPDSLKASHILIALQTEKKITRTKEEAKKIADSLKNIIQNDPSKLAEIAQAISDDPSAKENKGDLSWFVDQKQLVEPFNDACIKGKVGDVVVVESVYGYHVIYITGKTEPLKKVRVGILSYKIVPSDATYKNVFTTANKFSSENTSQELFESAKKKQGLENHNATIRKMDYKIPGIQQARELIRWAYSDDIKKGDVSKQVFEFENRMFVIAVLKDIREKGIVPLTNLQLKDYIKKMVLNEKKSDVIINKLNTTLAKTKDIYQIAAENKATVDTISQISFTRYVQGYGGGPVPDNNFGRRGSELEVIGKLFTLKKGILSKPIKGGSGVYILVVDDEIAAPPAKDFTMTKMIFEQMNMQRILGYDPQNNPFFSGDVFKVLKEKADITDNRIYYY